MPDPIIISFVDSHGTRTPCEVYPGQNLMDVALAAGIKGITGQCGGAINCATCMCTVAPDWLNQLPTQDPDETELLSYVEQANAHSRLSCQIVASHALNGLVLTVVDTLNPGPD